MLDAEWLAKQIGAYVLEISGLRALHAKELAKKDAKIAELEAKLNPKSGVEGDKDE